MVTGNKTRPATGVSTGRRSSGSIITVTAAAEGPLRDVDLRIPTGKLISFIGPAGSGCRTMAVDVLFEESRRQYTMALSPLERESLGHLRPIEVEEIIGLPPAIYVEPTSREDKSIAEVLQLDLALGRLWHERGQQHCLDCGAPCHSYDEEEAANEAQRQLAGERFFVLAPLAWSDDTPTDSIVRELQRAGFVRVRVGGRIAKVDELEDLDRVHGLEVVVDRLGSDPARSRLIEAVRNARNIAAGRCLCVGADSDTELFFNRQMTCTQCGLEHADLRPDDLSLGRTARSGLAANVMLGGRSIDELKEMSLRAAGEFCRKIRRTDLIENPIRAACDMGLGNLRLADRVGAISSGEYQRVLLSSSQSNGLSGLLYVFSTPTVGSNGAEQEKILEGLRKLVALGNTVISLDHSKRLVQGSDVVFEFSNGNLLAELSDEGAATRSSADSASGNADRTSCEDRLEVDIDGHEPLAACRFSIPLHRLVLFAGPSGSGKTMLLRNVIGPGLRSLSTNKGKIRASRGGRAGDSRCTLVGTTRLRRVVDLVEIQAPQVGSCLLGELGGFELVARRFAETPGSRTRNYPVEWFMLDKPGGRCVTCEGRGTLYFDMEFLEDIALVCTACQGTRYRSELLEVTFQGHTISEVLQLSVTEAVRVFSREQTLTRKLIAAELCGLGECKLGTSSQDLEPVQYLWLRVSVELGRATNRDLIMLDNPTAGIHPADCRVIVQALEELVQRGVSVLVAGGDEMLVEAADWVVELRVPSGQKEARIFSRGEVD